MVLNYWFYECFKINKLLGHSFELNNRFLSDWEFRFYNDDKSYGNYVAHTNMSFNFSLHNNSTNQFALDNYLILKNIKSIDHLNNFINKIKIFKWIVFIVILKCI